MGKIRTHEIKRAGRELLEKFPEDFTEDFQENKEFLKEKKLIDNKVLRNRVAGYMVKLVEKKKREEKKFE